MAINLDIAEAARIDYKRVADDAEKLVKKSGTEDSADLFFGSEESALSFIGHLLRRWGIAENILGDDIQGAVYVKEAEKDLEDGFILLDNTRLDGRPRITVSVFLADTRKVLYFNISEDAEDSQNPCLD